MDRHTEWQIDGQTDIQTNRSTDRQTDRNTDRHTDRHTDKNPYYFVVLMIFLQDTTSSHEFWLPQSWTDTVLL